MNTSTSVEHLNLRVDLKESKLPDYDKISNLTSVQLDSFYGDFLQSNKSERDNVGLEAALKLLDGVTSNTGCMELVYSGYDLSDPLYTINDCKLRGTSYSAALHAKFKIITYEKEQVKKNKKLKI